jgi:undecaprenyl-diphosphatase
MSTIAAGQVAGMTRASALEFSFFLSLPTMAAATLYDFYKTVIRHKGEHGATLPTVEMTTHRWVVLGIGFVVSFVVALAVVHWFMAWVRRHGFTPFAVYRVIAGAAVLWWASRGA